jgi:hypothetical protein
MNPKQSDPCPCGSGKAYSDCCFGKVISPQRLETLKKEKKDNDPYLGLSDEELDLLLNGDLDHVEPIFDTNFKLKNQDALEAPIMQDLQVLFEIYQNQGNRLPVDDLGDLAPNLVQELQNRRYPWHPEYQNPTCEQDLFPLDRMHNLFQSMGILVNHGQFDFFGAQSENFMQDGEWSLLYRAILSASLEAEDWQRWLPEEERHEMFYLVQDAGIFCLLLLRSFGKKTITYSDFYDRYVRAFPEYGMAVGDTMEADLARVMFKRLFLRGFCEPLGLIVDDSGPLAHSPVPTLELFRTTDLFRKTFRWWGKVDR